MISNKIIMHYIDFIAVCILLLLKKGESAGIGDNDKLLTTLDWKNPHVVSEVLTTTAVSCYVKASDVQGDVLTMLCPSECDELTVELFGTGVYSDRSYVCAAAIHDGRISGKEGGKVTIRKTSDKSSYVGSTAFNLTSLSLAASHHGSFIFLNAFDGRQSLYTVSCLAKGDFTEEKNFLVICPGGCNVVSNGVWGSELYRPDSYLCAAGIHSGKINAFEGGRISVHRVSGGQMYTGSLQNGFLSQGSNATACSLTLQECPQDLSDILSVGCNLQANHMMEDVFNVICPPGCSQPFSRVIGKGPYSISSTVCGTAVHDGLIQETLGGRVTVRKVPGLYKFETIRRNGITSEEDTTFGRGFIVQGSIQPFPSLLQVTCTTPASSILDDTFTVLCPSKCADVRKISIWGTNVYTENSSVCMAAVHSGYISGQDGGPVIIRKAGKQQRLVGTFQHGLQSLALSSKEDVNVFILGGSLENVESALTVSCDFTSSFTYGLQFTIRCPKTCNGAKKSSDSHSIRRVLEMDEAICKAATDVVGKTISVQRLPGHLVYSDSFKDFLLNSNSNVVDLSYGQVVVYDNNFDHPQFLAVSWNVKADEIHADTYSVLCPPMSASSLTQVFGTGIYTDDSHICAAALHDGRINIYGGYITVRKSPGLHYYIGSEDHGYTSHARDRPWHTSIVFQNTFYHIATTFTITCDTRGYNIDNEVYGVICPSGCLEFESVTHKSHIYTGNSAICSAAIQAGKITSIGGKLLIKRIPDKSAHKDGFFNNVTSYHHTYYDASFVFQ